MNKQHILDEIKRTAETNDGVPLGHRRFFTETGTREADWSKHWVRWSAAVSEAGLVPNQKNEPYSDELLIAELISLVREMGQFPSYRDLRMKARNDVSYPYDKVFARLGPKSQLVSKVVEYCRSHEGFEDVLPLCKTPDTTEELPSDEAKEAPAEMGFVYLLKSGRFHKIGRSNAVGRRERELAIQLPEKANLVHQIRTDAPAGIEAYWHRRFESQRKNGEWFELRASDISAFKRRKFMSCLSGLLTKAVRRGSAEHYSA